MVSEDGLRLLPALPGDALELAQLIDMAGEGLPRWYWSMTGDSGADPLETGAASIRQETGSFSYRKALVAVLDERPIGLMLGYLVAVSPPQDQDAIAALPPPLRPLAELMRLSIGTFYVSALALRPEQRGRGIGARLMEAAEARAAREAAARTSIQVYAQNLGAMRFYRRAGYQVVAARPIPQHPCHPYYEGEVLLLMKAVPPRGS